MRNKIQSIYKVRKTIVFSILISLLFIPVALQANDYIIINKIMYDSPRQIREQIQRATGSEHANGNQHGDQVRNDEYGGLEAFLSPFYEGIIRIDAFVNSAKNKADD